jgi:hypothetical protein
MMFAATVIGLSLVLLGLFILWLVSPAFRRWIEAPKYVLLDQEARFERAAGNRLGSAI